MSLVSLFFLTHSVVIDRNNQLMATGDSYFVTLLADY